MLDLRRGEPQRQRAVRRMTEWTPEVELLSVAVDRLAELIQAVAIGNGAKKTRPIVPMPRPSSAMDRARSRDRERRHKALVARVLPNRQNQRGG